MITTVINPARDEWAALCRRNTPDDADIEEAVGRIIDDVASRGDEALRDMALRYDGVKLADITLTPDEIAAAADRVSDDVKQAIAVAADNIRRFHIAQQPRAVDLEVMPGVRCLQRPVAIERVGLYIPGGQAPLFSTVLMLGIPASIAGCRHKVLCTPRTSVSDIAPEIIYAANVCGIDRICCAGGAQAIAAMAFGTDSVPAVDKIFGPGNRYVTKAKQLLSRRVAIDMPAGPSEVMVMADHTSVAEFVAADMLSQAEHGPDSQAILVCDSESTARRAAEAIERLRPRLSRSGSIDRSLSHSRAIVLPDRSDMVDFANTYAAEHLIISMERPWEIADAITSAGSVFVGNYSPESAGDYASGTNHTLPTAGWARSMSGVNMDSFYRKITYQQLTPEGLASLAPSITAMARAERLDAHALAVEIRTHKQLLEYV
ncbi:histidinol dehydrogenase [Paramuribaculum intestinale]|uniref:histidinol dehydrogenase n=1 Tax=Paramuribaculum intestinale TaxID=2094151 RepID=UPI0025A5A28F|nr:histidinol dehydrogenase [Paramuribaculum intestinale]